MKKKVGRPTLEKKDTVIKIRLSKSQLDAFDNAIKICELNRSDLLRNYIVSVSSKNVEELLSLKNIEKQDNETILTLSGDILMTKLLNSDLPKKWLDNKISKDIIVDTIIGQLKETQFYKNLLPMEFTKEDVVFTSDPILMYLSKVIPVRIKMKYVNNTHIIYYYTVYMNYDSKKKKSIFEICIEDEYIRERVEVLFDDIEYLGD